jgi:hypothetical protein
MVPADLPAATLAKGYRWAHGRDPHRDPERRACRAYSQRELIASLQALGLQPPPPRPSEPLQNAAALAVLWRLALQALPLPSTRMLLCHHGELVAVSQRPPLLAVVEVSPNWRAMVGTRRELLRDALQQAWGEPVDLRLEVAQ